MGLVCKGPSRSSAGARMRSASRGLNKQLKGATKTRERAAPSFTLQSDAHTRHIQLSSRIPARGLAMSG